MLLLLVDDCSILTFMVTYLCNLIHLLVKPHFLPHGMNMFHEIKCPSWCTQYVFTFWVFAIFKFSFPDLLIHGSPTSGHGRGTFLFVLYSHPPCFSLHWSSSLRSY